VQKAGFWDNGPFYKHLPQIEGFGIETTADKIGVAVGLSAAAGVAGHAILTNIRKHREIANAPETTSELKHLKKNSHGRENSYRSDNPYRRSSAG
jgi:hypothetical protein